MNAIELLRNDHSLVKSLFSKFDRAAKTDHQAKYDAFVQIRRELQVHSRAEEQIFYPAVKATNGEGQRLISNAVQEHGRIDLLLTEISRLKPTDSRFDENVETLMENVDHHVEEEEGEIFQFAEENFSEQQLGELGQQIERRKHSLDQEMAA